MSDPVNLAAKRWEKGDSIPRSHTPRDALEAALARLDKGFNPDHVIICFAASDEFKNRSHFMQAGKFDSYAQLGLLSHVAHIMENGG